MYLPDGTLTENADLACKYLSINSDGLLIRGRDFFGGAGITQNIMTIRYKHYEDKRRGSVKLIEETIRGGFLTSLKETFGQSGIEI